MRRIFFYDLTIIALLASVALCGQIFYKKYFLPHRLMENSGVWRQSNGNLLWINDSGNSPTVFITDSSGALIREVNLPCRNVDWEEMTGDDKGNIYIGDFGNNANTRRDQCIYVLDSTLQLRDSIHFSYENQVEFPPERSMQNFDMEAMVWHAGKLHLFSKDRMGNHGLSRHYVLLVRGRMQTARQIQELSLNPYVVSGAATRNDDGSLFLLAYRYSYFLGFMPDTDARIYQLKFSMTSDSVYFQKDPFLMFPTWLASAQYEAIITLPGHRLLISAEGRKGWQPFFRIIQISK